MQKEENNNENQQTDTKDVKQENSNQNLDLSVPRNSSDGINISVKNQSNQNIEIQGTEKQKQSEKKQSMITISRKQLNAWTKKSTKLTKENDILKKQLQNLQKKAGRIQGLQETIKSLQSMVDQSTRSEQKFKRDNQKMVDLFKIQKDMNNSYKQEIQQLRNTSHEYFTLKQQLARVSTENRSLRQAKQQYPRMIAKTEQQQQMIQNLKEKIEQKIHEVQNQRVLTEKLEKKVDALINQKKMLQRVIKQINLQKEQALGQIDALSADIDDQRTEKQVQNKKLVNQIKQLKLALHHQHQKLILTEHQLSEAKSKSKNTVDLSTTKMATLSKQDLFNLLQQAQMKNVTLKISLNNLTGQHEQLKQKIKQKDKAIFAITRELLKAFPNLDESQGMEYVQKDIIQIGKEKKSDWGEIVQKVMIENLRLKYSVTALGQEYNQRMREQRN